MTTKICSKCKEEKDFEEFGNNKSKKDGKSSWCKECNKIYYKKNEEKIKERYKTYNKKNEEELYKYNKEYISSSIKYSHSMIKELSVYDQVTESEEGFAIVQCVYCGSDVIPTILQVRHRIKACNSLKKGECRIYCNDNNDACKKSCPSFKRVKYPLGFKPASSREVDPLLRQLCFKRDNYTCKHCNVTIKEAQLHCHHISGVTQSPIEQNDLSNVITLCKQCHKELHKSKGCTYQDYQCG